MIQVSYNSYKVQSSHGYGCCTAIKEEDCSSLSENEREGSQQGDDEVLMQFGNILTQRVQFEKREYRGNVILFMC